MNVEQLFRAHHDDLFRYLARYSGDPELAMDAVQETFMRFHRRPPRHTANVRAWLFRVGTNVVRDTEKLSSLRRRRLAERPSAVPGPQSPTSPMEAAELAEERALLSQALHGLRPREREAVLMRAQGFTHREIAQALGTTTGTVGTLLVRALGKLAARLEATPLEASAHG